MPPAYPRRRRSGRPSPGSRLWRREGLPSVARPRRGVDVRPRGRDRIAEADAGDIGVAADGEVEEDTVRELVAGARRLDGYAALRGRRASCQHPGGKGQGYPPDYALHSAPPIVALRYASMNSSSSPSSTALGSLVSWAVRWSFTIL